MRGRTRKRKGRPALKQIDLFIVSFFLVGRQGVLPGVASAGGGSEDEKEEEKSIIEYNTITLLRIPIPYCTVVCYATVRVVLPYCSATL